MGNQTVIRILTALLLALCLVSCGADWQITQDTLTVYESASKWIYNTPDSTCFSRVGYDSRNNVLIMVFRDSGAEYHYYDVPTAILDANAESQIYQNDLAEAKDRTPLFISHTSPLRCVSMV